MEKPLIAVITSVPDPSKNEDGNLCICLGSLYIQDPRVGSGRPIRAAVDVLGPGLAMSLVKENFALGEILLLDENGREYAGEGRKPSKWYVDVETFDTIEKAIKRALEVKTWS